MKNIYPMLSTPFRQAGALAARAGAVAVAVVIASCGGGSGTTGSGDTSAAISDSINTSLTLYTAALEHSEAFWASLPHTDIAGDLAAVAADMQSSGIATGTYVSENGITATLTDGTRFVLIYDDRDTTSGTDDSTPSSQATKVSSQSVDARSSQASALQTADSLSAPIGSGAKHQIMFFVNDEDRSAFVVKNQIAFANAFLNAGLPASEYEVEARAVDLDTMLQMESSHPIDFLDIATHGTDNCDPGTQANCMYSWASNDVPIFRSWLLHYGDIQRVTMGAGGLLKLKTIADAEGHYFSHFARYWFTPEFVTTHLQFNPGAVVMNSSCYAQSPKTAAASAALFAKAGAGLYAGWTGPARGWDADQSEAYMIDRMLGGTNPTGLGSVTFNEYPNVYLVIQRSPAQRPFPLTDIIAAMPTTIRSVNPAGATPPQPNAFNVPGQRSLTEATNSDFSNLVFTTLNGGGTDSNLIVWNLPSISNMETVESATGATLTVHGSFPAHTGTGQIVDASGTHVLSPTTWSSTQVTFLLPPTGSGASGVVTIFSDEGVASNAVPLTEWSGQLFVTVNDTAPATYSTTGLEVGGIGSGTISTTTNLHFRADVHPVVAKLDSAPVAQNFAFSGVMGDATTLISSADATFLSTNGLRTMHYSLVQPVTSQNPVYSATVTPGTFTIGPYSGAGASSSCNNGLPGPQTSGPTNVFCPFGGIYVSNAISCSDNDGTLCAAPLIDYTGFYGYPPIVSGGTGITGDDGLLIFTMDPNTYAITFSSRPARLQQDYLFGSDTLGINLQATIQAPLYPPK